MPEPPANRPVIELRVLGPVDASADGRRLALGGAKPRAVLAMLALEANRALSVDRLIEGLWGEHPPPSAGKMVQTYVWRLRTVLGQDSGAAILTRGRGYELRVDPDAVDVRRFERLLAHASRDGRGGGAGDAAREALALWRGPALADVADEPFAPAAIRRLDELRVEAAELAIEADLAAGRHLEVAAEVEPLLAEHPLRERLHAQRMLALYRCGRQAAALEAFRQARRTLVDEVGVEPGPELRALHQAILRQEPSLQLMEAPELPRELDPAGASPLAGRETELGCLRSHWQRARSGAGTLLALAGEPGMGKTRLAAELAAEAHREGGTVLYAAGTGAPGPALAALAAARAAVGPTLLVVDDAERAPMPVLDALAGVPEGLQTVPAFVVATGRDPAALDRLRPRHTLRLEPLDAAAVRQIAVLHAPAGAAAEVPMDALLETSGGVARKVHEAAGAWARQEAARRVGAVARRAAAGRSHARALEAELAGRVVDLQATRERAESLTAERDGADGPAACPYKGLAAFDVGDADLFFGRERLVAAVVARLAGAPLLAVVGPSGSGKSSLIRAGLLPALAAGVLPGSENWPQELMRPGERPLRRLYEALGRLRHARHGVLVVDQFEELFTTCPDERERAQFIAELVAGTHTVEGTDTSEGATLVLLAVRADFYGRCGAYPDLSAALGAGHVLLSPMTRDELRQAIELPAERVGLRLEPGLVERLLADCEGESGALPLLSTALAESWRERDGRHLRLAGYERTGGVRGAVARLAEEAYGRLGPEQRAVARRILLRLAGDDVQGVPVGRRVPLAELDALRDDDVRRVLDVLAGSRLLTVSAGSVEVAHEALLRAWPRLRAWLEEDAEGRRVHHALRQAASGWSDGGRDPGELYRGARLASALEWRAAHEPELNATEQQFLEAGRIASVRARRRLRLLLLGVAALLVMTTGAALVALEQRGQARAEARAAQAQRLGAQGLTEEPLDRALLLARQGVALDDTPATRDSLLAVLRRSPAAVGFIGVDGATADAIALHPDGRTLAVGADGGRVLFVDAVSRRRLGRPHQLVGASRISSLAFSPDGTRLAAAGWADERSRRMVDLFDGRRRRHIVQLSYKSDPAPARVHFSPDSRVLAVQSEGGDRLSGDIIRWDARTGEPWASGRRPRFGGSSTLLGFIGAPARVVTSGAREGGTAIRELASMRALRRFPAAGPMAALSPAAGLVALGGRDGAVRMLDLRSGELRTARARDAAPLVALRFDPRGTRLVTAHRDGRLILWDAGRLAELETLDARGAGPVRDLQVSPDGRTAYTTGGGDRIVVWDLAGDRRREQPFATDLRPSTPHPLVVSDAGSQAAVIDARGFAALLDGRTLRPSGRIRPSAGRVSGAAVAPDGRTIALTTYDGIDGTVEFWDTRALRRLGTPQPAHAGPAGAVTWSADGRRLVTGDPWAIRLWDARRRRLVSTDQQGAADVDLSPDGTLLAATLGAADPDGGLQIRSVPGLELLRTVRVPQGSVGRFAPDGRSLAYGARDGGLWMLDTRTWKARGRPLRADPPVLGAAFSPDGRLLATTSGAGAGRLRDVGARRPVGTGLSGGNAAAAGAAFLSGGARLAVLHEGGGGVVWDVRPGSWARQACAVAGRPLTRAEWQGLLPGRPYAPACASSP